MLEECKWDGMLWAPWRGRLIQCHMINQRPHTHTKSTNQTNFVELFYNLLWTTLSRVYVYQWPSSGYQTAVTHNRRATYGRGWDSLTLALVVSISLLSLCAFLLPFCSHLLLPDLLYPIVETRTYCAAVHVNTHTDTLHSACAWVSMCSMYVLQKPPPVFSSSTLPSSVLSFISTSLFLFFAFFLLYSFCSSLLRSSCLLSSPFLSFSLLSSSVL